MAIVRTAKGTASTKTSGTTLTLASVAADKGATLVVWLGYEDSQGDPTTVKWGKKEMKLVAGSKQGNTTSNKTAICYKTRVRRDDQSKDIVATWSSAIAARTLVATQITEASKKDVNQKREHNGTGAPGTGSAVTSTVADTISIAAFVSAGPSSDTAGTAGAGHTLGQRVGTTGAPPASNVTIQETFEILSATGNIRATMTGATSRDWSNSIVAFQAGQTFTVMKVGQDHRDQNQFPDWVVVEVEDEANAPFQLFIDPEEFDAMTDADVTDRIKEFCVNYTDRLDGDSVVDEDSVRDTRMATFVNDEVII